MPPTWVRFVRASGLIVAPDAVAASTIFWTSTKNSPAAPSVPPTSPISRLYVSFVSKPPLDGVVAAPWLDRHGERLARLLPGDVETVHRRLLARAAGDRVKCTSANLAAAAVILCITSAAFAASEGCSTSPPRSGVPGAA